jgi:hypothetical protein
MQKTLDKNPKAEYRYFLLVDEIHRTGKLQKAGGITVYIDLKV